MAGSSGKSSVRVHGAAKWKPITDAWCRGKWAGGDEWINEGGNRGGGRFKAKRTQSGVTFYFQYFDSKEQRRFLRLGYYRDGTEASPYNQDLHVTDTPLGLAAARSKALLAANIYREHRDLEAWLTESLSASQRAAQALAQEEEAAQRLTLARLIVLYSENLRARGKETSARDALSHLKRYVEEAEPGLAQKPAKDVTTDDIVTLISHVTATGKMRAAGQFRATLNAAFNLAIKARTDASAAQELREFALTSNPVAPTGSLSEHKKAKDRNLDADELAAVLHRIDAWPEESVRDTWLALLYLGGQRQKQLVRVRVPDVDLVEGTVLLKDPKGRRTQARPHLLPLVGPARPLFQRLVKRAPPGGAIFTRKVAPIDASYISTEYSALAKEMLKAREIKDKTTLGDFRRTAETMMASMGIDTDTRAHIQSHGLGGVQNKHYNRWEYMPEKKAALTKWCNRLEQLRKAGQKKEAAKHKVGK